MSAVGPAPIPDHLRLVVTGGPDRGRVLDLSTGSYLVGTDPACELALCDATVSRRHLEVGVLSDGLRVRDLGSTNGSFLGGARFESILVGAGAVLEIGHSQLRVFTAEAAAVDSQAAAIPPSESNQFGDLLGESLAMRQIFALLERMAASDAPVLIEGETGTGKELVVEALHASS